MKPVLLEMQGMPVVFERAADVPLVDVSIVIRGGASLDPQDEAGRARLAARLVRCGVRGQRASAVDGRLDVIEEFA